MSAVWKLSEHFLRGTSRQGGLVGLTEQQITATLGFEPIRGSADGKCSATWVFAVGAIACAVWDYKGSGSAGRWSFSGPEASLRIVFGDAVEKV